MRGTLGFVLVVAACSSPESSTVDSGGGGDGAGDSQTGELVDPEWPADEALPAELDFPPYLNVLDGTTIVVSWRTVGSTTGTVRYGTTPAYGAMATSSTAGNLHHVTLSGLQPKAAYYYEVSIDGTTASRKGVFVVPGRDNFRWMQSGEYHAPSESSNVAKFSAAIRAFRPHVIVESGDMVDDGNSLSQWRSYLRTAAPWISNTLLLPSHSNHVNGSGGNATLKNLFVLPNNERWYTTRLGNMQVINVDSTYSANTDLVSAEVPWLRQTVKAAHDGTDDPTFLVASWHHPACSSQYLTRNGERAWVQDNLVATIKANGGIDLILAAHDKYYERSTITGGIVHLITNIGNISPEIPGGNHPDCTAVKTSRNVQSTAFFTVTPTTMTARMIDQTATEIDTFTISK